MIAYRRVDSGFTLLELMIAISIFAVVSALAYGGLNAVLVSANVTRDAATELEALQLGMAIMTQDLSQITDRPIRDPFGDQQPALQSPDPRHGGAQFTRRGWPNPNQQMRGTLQRLYYRHEVDTLWRGYWPALDAGPNDEPVEVRLLEGIERFGLRFMAEDHSWVERWPPLSTTPDEAPSGIPRAVELTLQATRWGEIQRVIVVEAHGHAP
ncbi:MAG: type II secretion system minor pseudopilin GspJ [Thiotrichales bacterium]